MSLESDLANGVAALQLSLPPGAEKKLLSYIQLIEKWNRVYNLTAVREAEKMLTHHVLDSLAVAPHLPGGWLLDVGSGPGLPGIPLALALPQTQVTLLEGNHKKASFLKQAVIELALTNADVVNARVESWNAPRLYDVVISRAFSDLPEFVGLGGRLCAANGVIAAMKGVYPYEELAQLPAGCVVKDAVRLSVPGLTGERHLVLLHPTRA